MTRKQQTELLSRAASLKGLLLSQNFSEADADQIATSAITRALNDGEPLTVTLTDGSVTVDIRAGVSLRLDRQWRNK